MECQKVKTLIPIFLDHELEPQETEAVKEHLGNCLSCRKELKLYQESWALLSDWKDLEPAPGYVSRFWTKLATERSFESRILEGIRTILAPQRLTPALATLSVIVFVGAFVFKQYLPTREAEQALAKMAPEEIEFVQNIELAQHIDVIENIDVIEDLDILENLDTLES